MNIFNHGFSGIREKKEALEPIVLPSLNEPQPQNEVMYFHIEGKLKECQVNYVEFYELIFFESGSGNHTIDKMQYEISGSQIHVSFPGQVHIWNINNYSAHRFLLGRQFVEQHFPTGFLSTFDERFLVVKLDQTILSRFKADLKHLITEICRKEIDISIIKLRLEIILNYIERSLQRCRRTYKYTQTIERTSVHGSSYNLLLQLKELLDQHYKEEKEVSFYAGKLFITQNYLNKLCRKQWGVSAKSVINNRVTIEAIRLLMHDKTYPVSEIATRLGFRTASNFSRFLKLNTSYTPSQLRTRLKSVVDW